MRVLIVSQYFWPESFIVNDLACELARRGHVVTVLTGWPNYPQGRVFADFAANPSRYARLEGCDIVRVPLVPRGRRRWQLALNYLSFALSASLVGAWKLRGKPVDAILTFQMSPVTMGVPAVVQRWLKGAGHVFWVQDLWPETLQAVDAVRSPWLLGLMGRLVAFLYRRSDRILVQAEGQVDAVRARAGPGASIGCVTNWAPDAWAVAEGAGPDRGPDMGAPVDDGILRVMFAGNLGDAQDFPAVLEAARQLRDEPVHWQLVGDGRQEPWIRQEITRLGLERQVSLPGRFEPERMPGLYARADALLVSLRPSPLFAMTVPSKLQTYLAAGRPVLGMLDGEGARLIERAGAGLTCPAGDSAGLAHAVLALLRMPPRARARMGEAGRRHAREHFDRGRLIDRIEHALADVARGAGRSVA